MAYISEMFGKPVADFEGEPVGVLDDLVATTQSKYSHPMITAIQVKTATGKKIIHIDDVAVLIAPAIPLRKHYHDIAAIEPDAADLLLARDILDKQIIDTNGIRLVRVNDLEIKRVGDQYFVVNVDIGGMGLMRRLGLGKQAQKIKPGKSGDGKPSVISWDVIELISKNEAMRLKVPGDKLKDLHPADIAEIVSDMNRMQSGEFLDHLDVKVLADTLEEVEPDFQASLVESMDPEKVADVLEEMAPDEAADLLAELPEERSKELLELMEDADADDVRKLLTFDEDTAGGIMTTEFVAVKENLTADETIKYLRENATKVEQIYYVYVTDELDHLIGVFSLSDLVLAKPRSKLLDIMHRRVARVQLGDSQEHVAHMISKYNLLAIPVVDEEEHIHGIVTADDALDKIIPTAWKKRLPRMYR